MLWTPYKIGIRVSVNWNQQGTLIALCLGICMRYVSFMTDRIAVSMEGIIADFIEEIDLRDNQQNITESFTSANKSITFSGFKVSGNTQSWFYRSR